MPLWGGRIGFVEDLIRRAPRGIRQVKASHRVDAVFDDPNLVGSAGLLPVLRLAEAAGLYRLLGERLTVASPNAPVKAAAVVAGMLTGADCIDDLDVLRHGAMGRLFTGVRAPSTLGTFLRCFTFGHVRQLDAVNTRLLAGLATSVPRLLAGCRDPDSTSPDAPGRVAFVDVDDTIRAVHGHAKQGTGYGYTRVNGLNAQLAVLSSNECAPVIVGARLRKGNVYSSHGGPRMVADAVSAARAAGVTVPIMVRADSAYYSAAFVAAAVRARAWFSVTARMNQQVRRAIAGIDEAAWTPIRYRQAILDQATGQWVTEAFVAEVSMTAFTSRARYRPVPCRLVVRRVARLNEHARDGQDELFTSWRYHAFITNSEPSQVTTVRADEYHRDHAIVEQVIAELKDGPLAHLPSGRFTANAAWLALTCIAFNIARAAGAAASARHARARWATLRRQLINIPARIATSARRVTVHLPQHWPWAPAWQDLWADATRP
jgi:hypothetical protein